MTILSNPGVVSGVGGPGGPGGGQSGPGGGGPGSPGGIFCCYRYAPNYAGLVNKDLTPGKALIEVVGKKQQVPRADRDR